MFLGSNWARRPGMNWGYNHYYDDDTNYYPHRRMVIRGNELNAVGGDGIVLLAARDSYIENNTCYYAQLLGRPNFWNAGIWTHSCRYTVIQYNEAAYTQKDNGAGDGQEIMDHVRALLRVSDGIFGDIGLYAAEL